MWYEVILGLFVVGVLMVLTGLYRKGFDRMDRTERRTHEQRWLWGFVVGVAALWAVSAAAEPINYGLMCFQKLPFDDRLEFEVVQLDASEWTFALYARQVGQIFPDPPTYVLKGGGMAVRSGQADESDPLVISINIPFHNTTTFFGGHPMIRFTAILTLPGLTGPWFGDSVGGTGGVFVSRGTLRPVDCDEPNPPVSPAVRSLQSQTIPKLEGQ